MIALGLDGGPTKSAYAVVRDHGPTLPLELIEHGLIASTYGMFRAILNPLALPDLVVIEKPADFISSERGRAKMGGVLDTAWKSGMFEATLRSLDPDERVPVVRLPANAGGKNESWRYLLTGNPRAGDDDVAWHFDLMFPGVRTNEHVRDAACMAAAAIMKVRREGRAR